MHAQLIEIAHEKAEHRFLVHHGPHRAPVAPVAAIAAMAPGAPPGGPASNPPIVLVAGQPTSLRVRLQLAGPAASAYRLEAHLGGTRLLAGHVAGHAATALAIRDVEVHVAHPPAGFAVVRGADLDWRLIEDGPGGAQHALPAPPLALVWLPAAAASVLARGVPIELVHLLADALEAGGLRLLAAAPGAVAAAAAGVHAAAAGMPEARAPEQAVASVVHAVFERGQPVYDSYSGSHHYTDIPRRDGDYDFDRITLLLSRYLRDPVKPCNCYDIAAVLQFFLRCIGVRDVTYCYMNPFGYLERSGLIGLGETNNPFFKSNQTEKVVPERDPKRSSFYNHAFCRFDGGRAVADATAGPHLGAQGSEAYALSATDGDVPEPPEVTRGNVQAMTDHTGVVHVDMIVSGQALRRDPQVREFIERVGYHEPPHARAVACAWPGPLEGGLDPALWREVYQETVPGEHEVHRHWSLAHGRARVTIGLYVAKDSATAQERFLAIGSNHSFPRPIFDAVPNWPGHAAAVQRHAEQQRLAWLHHNVVCDVMIMHPAMQAPVDVEALGRWLLAHAEAAVVDDPAPHRPRAAVSAVSQPAPQVGERTRIDVACDAGHLVEFVGAPAGLRLVERGHEWFELVGTAPATDRLVVTVIDPRTLLHHAEAITLAVRA